MPMLLKTPTWSDLIPRRPCLVPAQGDLATTILRYFKNSACLQALQFSVCSERHFVLTDLVGSQTYLKVVPDRERKNLLQADCIAQWLQQVGLLVLASHAQHEIIFKQESILVLEYPYIIGSYPQVDLNQASRLGKALALLHGHLSQHPDKKQWRSNTQNKYMILEQVRKDLMRGSLSAGPNPSLLRQLANTFDLGFYLDDTNAQPLHGDLNPSNLLFQNNDELVLLDFEDVHHSYLPVITDLYFLLERLIIIRQLPTQQALEIAHHFLNSYQSHAGGIHLLPLTDLLGSLLEITALKSLCTLTLMTEQGESVSHQEWFKFFHLLNYANYSKTFLRRIFR